MSNHVVILCHPYISIMDFFLVIFFYKGHDIFLPCPKRKQAQSAKRLSFVFVPVSFITTCANAHIRSSLPLQTAIENLLKCPNIFQFFSPLLSFFLPTTITTHHHNYLQTNKASSKTFNSALQVIIIAIINITTL